MGVQLARDALTRIFTSVKYLDNQEQAIRGNTDYFSNLLQLMSR